LATSDGNNSRLRCFFDRGMALACGVILLSGMLILLYLFNPLTSGIFPPCPFHYLTGMHCPGCGSLRAVHKILHGDLAGALAMNPLLVLSLPLFPVAVFRRSWLYLSWLPLTFLLIILLFGVLRNIPLWPFMLLAPH